MRGWNRFQIQIKPRFLFLFMAQVFLFVFVQLILYVQFVLFRQPFVVFLFSKLAKEMFCFHY